MKKNESSIDRVVRIGLGLAILGAGLYFESLLGLIGFVPIATGAIGYCPLYTVFGINTCQAKKD